MALHGAPYDPTPHIHGRLMFATEGVQKTQSVDRIQDDTAAVTASRPRQSYFLLNCNRSFALSATVSDRTLVHNNR